MDYSSYDKGRYCPTLLEAINQGNRTLEAIKPFFDCADNTQRVLEVGCASGSFLKVIQEKGYSVAKGIDVDPELVFHGRQVFGVELEVADWLSYVSTSDETYDIILVLDVIEHISPLEIEAVLAKTYERLNSGGRLILRMPNPACPFVLPTFYGDLTHKFLITTDLMKYLLRKSGFMGEIVFKETRPHHKFKKLIYLILHHGIVKPLITLFHYHFYGVKPGPITRNIYCCAVR